MFNSALWKKALIESRWLLASCALFIFAVLWLRVWISSFFSSSALENMFSFMPEVIEPLLPVPFSQIATAAGRIAVGYDDPVVLLLMTVWAISRGSDAVSGELNRGTMEMVLAQPVTRVGVLWTQALMTIAGGALLATCGWLGTSTGLATVKLEETLSPRLFLPPALNLFALTVFLAGLTTMVSSATSYRSRTIGIVGGFYAVSMVVKIVSRMAPDFGWLAYLSFFTPFEPQLLVGDSARAWSFVHETATGSLIAGGLGYDSILIGLGLVCYAVATVVFWRRDLPAPL